MTILFYQKDLENLIKKWESDWSMKFYPEKCELLRITKRRQPSNFTYSIHNVDNIQQTSEANILVLLFPTA